MKRVILLILLIFPAWSTLSAQDRGDLSFGGGITYGFDIEEIGIQAVGIYSLNNNIRVGADFNYWLSEDESIFGSSFSSTFFEINGNVHYLFYNNEELVIYGIGSIGIHYASISIDIQGLGSDSATDTELGLGLGAGAEYNLGPIKLYLEPRLFLSGFDQFTLSTGVRVPLNL